MAMLATLPASAGTDAALSQGRAWLVAHQNGDGSFGPAVELLPRDSAAAVQALTGGPADPAIARGAAYLTALADNAAYYRALRVQALARAGSPVGSLIASLGEFRNGEGMGAFGTYYSNLFDTTQSIEAYGESEADHLPELVSLLDYLRTSQGTDGGWGFLPNTPSQVYYTGEALWAISRLRALAVAPQVITNARSFLLSKLRTDGTFGAVVETAVAYRALIASGYQFTAAQPDPVAALLGAQGADGSWDADAYTTAEAIRALSAYRPNLVVSALSASPPTISAGSPVQVSVTIQNFGPQAAGASRLVLRAGAADSTDVRAETAVPGLAAGAVFSATLPVATAGAQGELLLFAVADVDGAVAESSELDNVRSVRIAIEGLPDLAVFPANVSLSVTRPQPATAFSVRVTVQNLGEQPVTSFGYRVTRIVAGAPVATLSTGTRGPLAAGASLLIDIPGVSLPEGEHTLLVELDPQGAVTETSEDDNNASFTFFVVDDTLADFALADADLTTTPTDAVPDQPVNVSLIVRNKGNQSGTGVVELFDGEVGSGPPVLSRTVTIGAGATSTVTGTFTPQASSVLLTAIADRAQQVPESDEANNRARRYLRQLPDLAVGWDSVTLLPEKPLVGDATTVRATIRNAGSLPSTAATVALYAGLPRAGGTEVSRATLGPVAAAGNATVDLPWTAAGGATDLTVVVDPENAILERSEANNQAVRRVTVARASGPNLQVASVDLAQATHSAVDLRFAGTVALTIANQGTAATAGTYLVRLFEDLDGDRRFAGADRQLATAVVDQPLAAGATTPLALPVDVRLSFAHSLVLAEVDATDAIAETREDDNLRALFGDCEEAAPAASFDAVEKWWFHGVEAETAPIVVQLSDDDGNGAVDSRDVPDVVFHTEESTGSSVIALSGLDGTLLWRFRSTAANPLVGRLAHLAAADLDGDGVVEIVAIQSNSRLLALDRLGQVRWVSDAIEGTGGGFGGAVAIGDLTGDGVPEIALGRSVVSNTGKLLGIGTGNHGRTHNYYAPLGVGYFNDTSSSVIADVDLDGINELVAGDTLYRMRDGVLTVVWDHDVGDNLMIDGFVAVGNLDADPYAEIVYVSSGLIMALNHDGSVFRNYRFLSSYFEGPTFWGGQPTIADVTGDGRAEVLVASDPFLYALRSDLSTLWRIPISEYGAQTGVTAFDLDGDGVREVLYVDQHTFYILDGPTGRVRFSRPNITKTLCELPVVADVDGDGGADVLVPSNVFFDGDASTQGLHLLSHPSWVGARPIWNEHSYHGTNVRLDGSVPAHETPSWQLGIPFRGNVEQPRPPRRLANLTLGLPRLGAATAQGIPVTLRVGNGGAARVGAGVEVTLAAASGGPNVGGGRSLRALPPGSWEDVTVYWQAPLSGPINVTATVDPAQSVAQCDRSDDQLTFELAEQLLPDLAIPAGGVTASGIGTAGQVIDLAVQVRNHGPAAAPATRVRVSDGPVPIGEAAVAALAPSTTATVTVHVDTLLLAAGVHSFHAVVDPDGEIPEVDEDNNSGVLQLDLGGATKPDLAPTLLTADPTTVTAGVTSTLSVEVLNRGTTLAGGFDVSFRVNGGEVAKVRYPGQLDTGGRTTLSYALST
ncbi:MAG TPA: CARDB domain-containing protein, partial [Thermoanaerobaculia bacterium]|nr:CARDB domain-containing protein [Thermoanaerobaculia bacterium]